MKNISKFQLSQKLKEDELLNKERNDRVKEKEMAQNLKSGEGRRKKGWKYFSRLSFTTSFIPSKTNTKSPCYRLYHLEHNPNYSTACRLRGDVSNMVGILQVLIERGVGYHFSEQFNSRMLPVLNPPVHRNFVISRCVVVLFGNFLGTHCYSIQEQQWTVCMWSSVRKWIHVVQLYWLFGHYSSSYF